MKHESTSEMTSPDWTSEQNEPRIICETGTNREIAQLIEGAIMDLGYRLVRVRMMGADGGATLQIMAERPDGTMLIEDCEAISRALSPLLDAYDPVKNKYFLEISSPGIDRVLVRRSDFEKWQGLAVKMEFDRLIDRRKRIRGTIGTVSQDSVVVGFEGEGGVCEQLEVPFAGISEAKLILTDELINEAQKRHLAAKSAGNDNTPTSE